MSAFDVPTEKYGEKKEREETRKRKNQHEQTQTYITANKSWYESESSHCRTMDRI